MSPINGDTPSPMHPEIVKNRSILLVAALVILVILGVGAWYMASKSDDNKPNTTAAPVATDTDNKENPNTSINEVPIRALGIQLVMGEGAKDVTFAETINRGKYGISTTSLEAFGNGCKAASGNVALIATYTDPNALEYGSFDVKNKNYFPNAVLIDGTYFAFDFSPLSLANCEKINGTDKEAAYAEVTKKVDAGFAASKIEKLTQ